MTNQPNQVRLTWEPEPLDEPEVFHDMSSAKWEVEGFSENVNVEQVRLIDANEDPASDDGADHSLAEEDASLIPPAAAPPITFNPDGSSDSAEIVLAARNRDDLRRVTVRVVGVTGIISREVTTDSKGESETDGHGRIQDTGPAVAE